MTGTQCGWKTWKQWYHLYLYFIVWLLPHELIQHSYHIELLVLVKLYLYIDMILYSSPIIAKLIHSTSSAGLS